ncbi:MAG: LCP family protein [Mycobacteriaceae bacterium]
MDGEDQQRARPNQPTSGPEGTQVFRRDPSRLHPHTETGQPRAWSETTNPEQTKQFARPLSKSRTPTQPTSAYAATQTPQPFTEPSQQYRPSGRRYQERSPTAARPPASLARSPRPASVITPKRRRWARRTGATLLVLIITFAVAVFYSDGKLNRTNALLSYPGRIADTPGTNWLLVGSDSRAGLSETQEEELSTGYVDGNRTDTIILVHIPEGNEQPTLVSIPRDSYLEIPGFGSNKVNAAFSIEGLPNGNPALLVHTVELATQVRIDHYAEIGFSGFATMVDAVGGVNLCIKNAIADPLAGINLPAGCQDLSGSQALGFVRSRATALADIDRMNNQREFMSALLKKSTNPTTLINPLKLWPMLSGILKSLKVDEGTHIWDLARLAWAMHGSITMTTVPIGRFDDTDVGNALIWDDAKATQFFGALAEDRPLPADLITVS